MAAAKHPRSSIRGLSSASLNRAKRSRKSAGRRDFIAARPIASSHYQNIWFTQHHLSLSEAARCEARARVPHLSPFSGQPIRLVNHLAARMVPEIESCLRMPCPRTSVPAFPPIRSYALARGDGNKLLAVNPTVGRQLPDIELQADGTGWHGGRALQ